MLTPAPVTRWSAQLSDPACELAYRLDRFADDKRRVRLLLVFGLAGNILNFLLEAYTFVDGRSGSAALIVALAVNVLPFIGLVLTMRARTPAVLEAFILAAIGVGLLTRLSMLTLHPLYSDMWPAIMIGLVFVIYLFIPIRVSAAVALAGGFSILAPVCWIWTQSDVLAADQFGRGLICLVLANLIGFAAANGLQRSQRIQFAQGLVLQQLLSTDAMTGIANRRRFDEELATEWKRCQRAGMPLSLLMIDVDHFKAYNDHYGHLQGDACLRQVAQLMVRDIGRSGDLVARYGGEEFVCLLPGVGSGGGLAVANKLAAGLRQADIAHPRSPAGPRLTMSIGVATASGFSGEPSQLVAFADKLLYAAKAAGRNQVAIKHLRPVELPARAA